jgi:hypothetical protein
MATCLGVFSPRNREQGLCSVAECESEAMGKAPDDSLVGSLLMCQEHLDEYAWLEVARVQES